MSDRIATLLSSRKTEDRIRAVRLLANAAPTPETRSLLLKALSDRANYVASLAAEALGQCAGETEMAAMTDRFLTLSEDGPARDPGCHVRAHLAFAFGRLEYTPATDALRIGIRTVQIEPVGGVPFDTGLHLRANCALALAQMRARDALRDITLVLFDHAGERNTVEARKAAAQAMTILGDLNALIPLTLRLAYPQNEMPEVLQECMQAVIALEDPRALELLEPYLAHQDSALAAYAALMIAQTQAPEAPALLRQALDRLSGDALRAVVLAFSILRSEEARKELRALAGSERESVRLAVTEALRGTQDAQERQCLERLADKDRSMLVRRAAKQALE